MAKTKSRLSDGRMDVQDRRRINRGSATIDNGSDARATLTHQPTPSPNNTDFSSSTRNKPVPTTSDNTNLPQQFATPPRAAAYSMAPWPSSPESSSPQPSTSTSSATIAGNRALSNRDSPPSSSYKVLAGTVTSMSEFLKLSNRRKSTYTDKPSWGSDVSLASSSSGESSSSGSGSTTSTPNSSPSTSMAPKTHPPSPTPRRSKVGTMKPLSSVVQNVKYRMDNLKFGVSPSPSPSPPATRAPSPMGPQIAMPENLEHHPSSRFSFFRSRAPSRSPPPPHPTTTTLDSESMTTPPSLPPFVRAADFDPFSSFRTSPPAAPVPQRSQPPLAPHYEAFLADAADASAPSSRRETGEPHLDEGKSARVFKGSRRFGEPSLANMATSSSQTASSRMDFEYSDSDSDADLEEVHIQTTETQEASPSVSQKALALDLLGFQTERIFQVEGQAASASTLLGQNSGEQAPQRRVKALTRKVPMPASQPISTAAETTPFAAEVIEDPRTFQQQDAVEKEHAGAPTFAADWEARVRENQQEIEWFSMFSERKPAEEVVLDVAVVQSNTISTATFAPNMEAQLAEGRELASSSMVQVPTPSLGSSHYGAAAHSEPAMDASSLPPTTASSSLAGALGSFWYDGVAVHSEPALDASSLPPTTASSSLAGALGSFWYDGAAAHSEPAMDPSSFPPTTASLVDIWASSSLAGALGSFWYDGAAAHSEPAMVGEIVVDTDSYSAFSTGGLTVDMASAEATQASAHPDDGIDMFDSTAPSQQPAANMAALQKTPPKPNSIEDASMKEASSSTSSDVPVPVLADEVSSSSWDAHMGVSYKQECSKQQGETTDVSAALSQSKPNETGINMNETSSSTSSEGTMLIPTVWKSASHLIKPNFSLEGITEGSASSSLSSADPVSVHSGGNLAAGTSEEWHKEQSGALQAGPMEGIEAEDAWVAEEPSTAVGPAHEPLNPSFTRYRESRDIDMDVDDDEGCAGDNRAKGSIAQKVLKIEIEVLSVRLGSLTLEDSIPPTNAAAAPASTAPPRNRIPGTWASPVTTPVAQASTTPATVETAAAVPNADERYTDAALARQQHQEAKEDMGGPERQVKELDTDTVAQFDKRKAKQEAIAKRRAEASPLWSRCHQRSRTPQAASGTALTRELVQRNKWHDARMMPYKRVAQPPRARDLSNNGSEY